MSYPVTWQHLFLAEAEPFFIAEEIAIEFKSLGLILDRDDFRKQTTSLNILDSYFFYSISEAATKVLLFSSEQFYNLAPSLQNKLLQQQVLHGRAHVYEWEVVKVYFDSDALESLVTPRLVAVASEIFFCLNIDIWRELDFVERQRFIDHYIKVSESNYQSISIRRLEPSKIASYEVVKHLAKTWAQESGPNCFSTTLAAITPDVNKALTISKLWLHQNVFQNEIYALGFRKMDDFQLSQDSQDKVLVWQLSNGTFKHASYLIANEIVLNKNSQAWYSQRQLVELSIIITDWQDKSLELVFYSRR